MLSPKKTGRGKEKVDLGFHVFGRQEIGSITLNDDDFVVRFIVTIKPT